MDNDQIDKLLHSYISGTITPQESRQLEAWGDESEENRQILDLIEGHSDLGGELSRMYRYDKEKVWRRVCEEDRRYMRRSRLLRSLRIGAAAAVLAGMLEHGWIEAELETGHPENRQIMETYAIEGWPFFVLIGPDGTILARNYTNAFYRAKKILDKELGGTAAE